MSLREILLRVLMAVLTAVVVPALLLWAVLAVSDFPIAACAALGWMVAAMCWRHATGREVSGLLVLSLVILTVRTVVSLAVGSSFLYFVQPVFEDLAVAALFLGSLCTARPLIGRMAPDFCPLEDDVSARPGMRSLFRRLTLMWGLVIVVKASITLVLLESLPTVDFVLVKGAAIVALTVAAAVVTIVWSFRVGRREGLVAPA